MGVGNRTEKRYFKAVRELKKELQVGKLLVLQTDKTGKFAILPEPEFHEKSRAAIGGLFQPCKVNVKQLKRNVLAILNECEMEKVANKVGEVTMNSFSIKFFLKDHKPMLPVRVVVNENGTWQKVVSTFFQGFLSSIEMTTLIGLRKSEELVSCLTPFHQQKCEVMSLDIKDLYYSLHQPLLLSRLRDLLEANLVRFQSQSGIDVGSFFNLTELYLNSTAVEFEGSKFSQKKGVCIGSSLAPALSEVYLTSLDSALGQVVQSFPAGSVMIKRYVDDILVCSVEKGALPKIKDFIVQAAPELTFSSEEPDEGVLQYVDLRLNTVDGLCREYGKLAAKPLLPYKSCHSKLVKRGAVMSLLDNAFKKSCQHKVHEAVMRQLARIKEAGYKSNIVEGVARKCVVRLRGEIRKEREKPDRVVYIPFFHKFSHNLLWRLLRGSG